LEDIAMLEEYFDESLVVDEDSFRERWRKIFAGLKAPRESGEYRWAKSEFDRTMVSGGTSTGITVVALLLLTFMSAGQEPPPPQLEVFIAEPETEKLEEIKEEPIEQPPEPEVVPTTMDAGSEVGDTRIENVVSTPSFGDDSSPDNVPVQAVDIATKSPFVIKGLYGARTGGGRAAAIGKYGGGGSDTVVLKALRWLKAHQKEDGSWPGTSSPTAMCGLALLCYMAHGETPSSKEFGATVEKAIRYLLYAQDSSSGRFSKCGAHYVYGHGIATYALAESYGMTKMVMLKEPMEKALQVIIDGQQPGGAWDYDYAKGTRRDLSASAWQAQALKAGKMAGAENPGLHDAIAKAVTGVKSFVGADGTFGYDGAGGSPVLTGAGVLCHQLLGRGGDKEVENGLRATENLQMSWPKGGGGTYAWYYATQARFQNGGPIWENWNKNMLQVLTQNQQADGHWLSNSTFESCDVYDTTLCCLCLEVYYRYLPTYAKVAEVNKAPATKSEAEAKIAVQVSL